MARLLLCQYVKYVALVALVVLVSSEISRSQQPETTGPESKEQSSNNSKAQDTKPPAKTSLELAVKTRPILNLSLKAEKAQMSQVAQKLSEQLKVPVFLAPGVQKELLSIEFSELVLEPALQLLAPSVYVDYEIDTGSTNPPRAIGIFFYEANQGEPPLTGIPGSSQSILIEGHTEEGVEAETEKGREEQPLRVQFKNSRLSIKAKNQPLPLVLLKIGQQLGIPVDIQDQDIEMVDVEISDLPVEDVVRQLSPNIRLFLRADLTRAERRALRLVLSKPAKTLEQEAN